jgi:hypothetical protein
MQPCTHSPESPPRRLLQVEFAGKPPGPKIARSGKTSAKQRRNAANHSGRRAALAPTGSIAQPAPSSQLPAPADTPPDDTRRHETTRRATPRPRACPAAPCRHDASPRCPCNDAHAPDGAHGHPLRKQPPHLVKPSRPPSRWAHSALPRRLLRAAPALLTRLAQDYVSAHVPPSRLAAPSSPGPPTGLLLRQRLRTPVSAPQDPAASGAAEADYRDVQLRGPPTREHAPSSRLPTQVLVLTRCRGSTSSSSSPKPDDHVRTLLSSSART